jgi:hypothetical protein
MVARERRKEKEERRKEKGERRKEKGERRKEKGERRKEKGERRKGEISNPIKSGQSCGKFRTLSTKGKVCAEHATIT